MLRRVDVVMEEGKEEEEEEEKKEKAGEYVGKDLQD